MGWKAGKNLASLLRKTAIKTALVSSLAIPLVFGGCEKPDEPPIEPPKDTTPPIINILFPKEGEKYNSNTIPFEWIIEEPNFNGAWYSTNSGQTKTSIGKSGAEPLNLPNGKYKLILFADDREDNFSTDTVNFSVDKHTWLYTANPFIQPNDTTLNWYGSGDINNDNKSATKEDLDLLVKVINNEYSNPSDTRLKDRSDINGDGEVNESDFEILAKKHNGVRLYLPGEWNLLLTWAEREDWSRKMFAIDKTDKIIQAGFNCDERSYQTYINFHGVNLTDIPKFLDVYPYDFSNNGRFNLPLYFVAISFYDSNNQRTGGHAMVTAFLGNSSTTWGDRCDIESQFDHLNVQIGQDYLDGTNAKFWVRGPPVLSGTLENGTKEMGLTYYITYEIKNNIPTLFEINPDINLITERGK
jgi:hypothetical protein